jgi:type I restriction enzyme, S subunit
MKYAKDLGRLGMKCKMIKKTPLYDLAIWKNGLAFRNIQFSSKGKPVIKIAELKNGITEQTKFTQDEFDNSVSLRAGDMLFSWSGNPDTSIDVFYYDLPDGWLNQHIFKVTPVGVDKDFLFYILKYYKSTFTAIASNKQTTGLGHVTIKDMKDIIVDVPSLETQKEIAITLSCLDNKIINNTKINHHLEQIAQAIFKSWFVDFDPWSGVMPEDWKEGTLSEIANITMGQSPDGASYNEDSIGKVFYQGRAEFGLRFPTPRLFTTQPKRMASKGDVLISVRAPVGDLNVAFEPCSLGRGLAGIQSNNGCQSFVLYTMFALKKQLDVFNGEGTVFGSINKNDMANLSVLIPTDEVIRQFEAIVHPIDVSIESNYAESCNLKVLRDTLLPRLMSGELSVSDIVGGK